MRRTRATNVLDLRRSNRSRVLAEIFLAGPLTRHELAQAAGVSPATVSNLVGELLEQGVLVEAGTEGSEGGRPRTLLQMNPSYGYVVGVDVGETAVLVELFDLTMRVLARHASRPRPGVLKPDQVVREVLRGLDRVVRDSGVAPEHILGVGVGVPGLVERGGDAVVHAQMIGWEAVPLGRLLRAGTALPLVVENGAKTLGQAEKWYGAARPVENAVVVLLGTGVGTSIITDGEAFRGPFGSASEWGHTTMTVGGRTCRCGAQGCLEAYVGARALVRRYDELRGAAVPTTDVDLESRIAAIGQAAADDPAASEVLREAATYLGAGLADLVNLFNPERIVVGGWLGLALADRLLPEVRRVASEQALRWPYSQVSIVAAELGNDAVALGAATLPMTDFLAAGAAPAKRISSRTMRRAALIGTGAG